MSRPGRGRTTACWESREAALRRLAGLLRAGLPLRAALRTWVLEGSGVPASASALARRLALGDDLEPALDELDEWFGGDLAALRTVLCAGRELGADSVLMLGSLADSIRRRDEMRRAATAAVAGARLSGRMVAALPLFCLPLLPLSRVPLFDTGGLVLISTGFALVIVGMRWVGRLVPSPPETEDPGAVVATVVAVALDAGTAPAQALELVVRHPPADVAADLRTARRCVVLGLSWPDALARSDHPVVRELGAVLQQSGRLGLPTADRLHDLAQRRRLEERDRLEAAVRRAPVLMVIPLATCVLPAFVVLGIGPFVRGLFLG